MLNEPMLTKRPCCCWSWFAVPSPWPIGCLRISRSASSHFAWRAR